MSFSEAVRTTFFQKYANFQGRALRSEFWWFILALTIAGVIATVVDDLVLGRTILEPLLTLATIVPGLSGCARRLHDIDRSGWWQVIQIIPVIGTIVLIVWFVSRGTPGPNRFGPAPGDA
jgi:uncharacterized membrane protein YhaH (DUF805 family)